MKNSNIYKCPVCGESLEKSEKSYICKNNHSFDIAKEGYAYLLLSNKKNSKVPGDSKEMILARKNFLQRGYYKGLSDSLNKTVEKYCDGIENLRILDAGCGEGYYIDNLVKSIGKTGTFIGIDISKEAVKYAAKRNKEIVAAVASVFELPVMDKSIDCLFSIFAPFKEEEFDRVLDDEGTLMIIAPGEYHLFGLKKALYENPYLNDESKLNLEKFIEIERIKIKYEFTLRSGEEIENLIKMTPYYWNTDMEKINEIVTTTSELTTEAEFMITVFKKRK